MLTLAKNNHPLSFMRMKDDIWSADLLPEADTLQYESVPVNIKASTKMYELQIAAPGYKKDDFKVLTERGSLIISAKGLTHLPETEEDYTCKEFSTPSFTRSFNLPDDVLGDNISARYEDGVLYINLIRSALDFNAKKEINVA